MGTVLETTICGPNAADRAREVHAIATALDAELTTWAADGPLIRLNRSAGGAEHDVPPELHRVLAESVFWWRRTGGAFDVSVGPLMRLWRESGSTGREPDADALREALARVGSDKIRFSDRGGVRLSRAGMALDLGGIGKGFAVDRMAEGLRRAGVRGALIDFGRSSLLAIGSAPEGDGWRVLLRRPDGPVVGVASLRDRAASVSATFGSSLQIEGRRFGHVVDPRSGRPLEREALAFVVSPDATQAEALSKALLVLGCEKGFALLATIPDVEALLVEEGGKESRTPGFDRAVAFEPLS
jgi:thiamine biosynthesis lipoprotein